MDSLIYDYETLGQDGAKAPVLSLALLRYDSKRFVSDPYSFLELVDGVSYYKFNVKEQCEEFGRRPEKKTLDWWMSQDKAIRDKELLPTPNDISIRELPEIFGKVVLDKRDFKIYTRGNSFDPVFTEYLFQDLGLEEPYNWWDIRDTRSLIEGLAWGSGLRHSYIPECVKGKFEAHNPIHDVAMDVMRIQELVRAIS